MKFLLFGITGDVCMVYPCRWEMFITGTTLWVAMVLSVPLGGTKDPVVPTVVGPTLMTCTHTPLL